MKKDNKKKIIFIVIALLLVLAKLWLISGRNYYINIDTYYDSNLQMEQAATLVTGKWLGSYSKITLCKSPGFPIFIMILNFLNISYPTGFVLFEILAIITFIIALKPIIKSKYYNLIILGFLLFGPFDLEYAYPYRNVLVPWAVLGIIAALIGIYLRVSECNKKKTSKLEDIKTLSIMGFIFSSIFWILREDSIWMAPFILTIDIIILIMVFISKNKYIKDKKDKIKLSIMSLLPTFGIICSILVISTINYAVYGVFVTNDRMKTYEAKVLGDLILIDDGTPLDEDVWVSAKSIELAKENSESFKSLNLLPFDQWPRHGDYSIWALRDSMSASGYYIDAKSTNEMYEKIHEELSKAFDEGKLQKKKGIKISDTSGIYSFKEVMNSFSISIEAYFNHMIYKYLIIDGQVSSEKEVDETILGAEDYSRLELYENLLKIELYDDSQDTTTTDVGYIKHNRFIKAKKKINSKLSDFRNKAFKYTSYVLLIISIISIIMMFIKKEFNILLVLAGILLTGLVNSFMVCLWANAFYVNASTPTIYEYTHPQYLLIFMMELICVYKFGTYIVEFVKNKKKDK